MTKSKLDRRIVFASPFELVIYRAVGVLHIKVIRSRRCCFLLFIFNYPVCFSVFFTAWHMAASQQISGIHVYLQGVRKGLYLLPGNEDEHRSRICGHLFLRALPEVDACGKSNRLGRCDFLK
jgi:hypothetical protein